jgi:hypothetical protein
MKEYSRRQFLEHIGASAAFLMASRSVLSFPNLSFSTDSKTFEMLVVGDSLISAQGLREQNKFYYLVKDWLQADVFGASRRVNLKVKAHVG